MIYTVTFNPSLDYIVTVPEFELGKTNRTAAEQTLPGGKGINVSTVLKNLGFPSVALGFVGGYVGDEIQRRLLKMGLQCDFITISGCSRINVKLKNYNGTEINSAGPVISEAEKAQLIEKLQRLKAGDILVLAGSIPASLPATIYSDIMDMLEGRGVLFVVDATKELLLNVLKYHPFLVKPNHHELGEIYGVELKTRESVIPYAKRLKQQGAQNVLVSMGGEGAVLVDAQDQVHMLSAPEGELVNAVGAGDSMVAGFLAGWLETKDYQEAFRMGLAAGSASACSEELADRRAVDIMYRKML